MCGCHLSSTCPVSRPIIVPIDCPALRQLRANNPVIDVSSKLPKSYISYFDHRLKNIDSQRVSKGVASSASTTPVTVTICIAVPVLPALSIALQVTIVVPTG